MTGAVLQHRLKHGHGNILMAVKAPVQISNVCAGSK